MCQWVYGKRRRSLTNIALLQTCLVDESLGYPGVLEYVLAYVGLHLEDRIAGGRLRAFAIGAAMGGPIAFLTRNFGHFDGSCSGGAMICLYDATLSGLDMW